MARIARPPSPLTAIDGIDSVTMARVLGVGPTIEDRYLHWDEVRRREPPEGLNREQWWAGLRMARRGSERQTELVDKGGAPFTYSLVNPILQRLHHLDLRATGRSAAPAAVVNRATRSRYKVHGLIEEAISSSQLEGAVTARAVAKEMLRAGRSPRDRSERMIHNNYRTIRRIAEVAQRDLPPDLLLELHTLLTEDTLERSVDSGRFQTPDEPRVRVIDRRSGEVVHEPPPAEEIPERIDQLCKYANQRSGSFAHPLVRAVILHFWLAYVHPFVDGNGRSARALFYWSALRDGYWLIEFVSISAIILKALAQYGRAFLHSETDSNDLTYFLIHQLDVLGGALDGLASYVDRTLDRTRAAEQVAGSVPGLNHRQRALLGHALRNPGVRYTYQSHANSHNVVRQTARTDLIALYDLGLLDSGKEGRQMTFIAPDNLTARLRKQRTG